jgi:lambda family phage portal protein
MSKSKSGLARIFDSIASAFGYSRRSNASIYSGATGTRLTLDWIATILSADQEIRGNLRLLRARGRELSRNNPVAKNFLNLLKANVVGPKGIGYQSQVRNNDGKLSRPINDKIEASWKEWAKKGNCTVDGKLSLRGVLELACSITATDGECFIRKVRGFPNKWGFALQMIDADQCDHLWSVPASKQTNEIRLGIEVDKWGRPVAYWISPGHPSDLGGSLVRERIPAEDMIHLYDPERVSQTRGVTWFHPVMLQLRMLEGYIEAELVAARTGAAKMGFFEYTDPSAYEEPNPDKKFTLEANPGTFETLPPGLKFSPWVPEHPAVAFPNFVVTILRQCATGLGVSYNALASDLVGVNYSSMRSGLLIEREQWKRDQSWLVEWVCDPVFSDWLAMSLLSGAVVLDSRDPTKFMAGKWEPRGWAWVDPLKDAQSAILAIGARLKSRDMIVSEEGNDIEDVFESIVEEENLAEELGLDLTLPSDKKPTGAEEDQSKLDEEEGDEEKDGKSEKSFVVTGAA